MEDIEINYMNCKDKMKIFKTKEDIIKFLFKDFAEGVDEYHELTDCVLSRKKANYTVEEIKKILALKLSKRINLYDAIEIGFDLNTNDGWRELMKYVESIYNDGDDKNR